ncbi:winged helix-turn-helix domain-containing protein [Streptomyces sp. NPDC058319]|uniref:winged helix-turn-helix domain-containing protein n=1 Tax=unclassified Streptomyces TaxID=2593676 RepID=UPI0036EF97B8
MSGVPLKAVDGWWVRWQAGGREALVMRPRGKPVGVHQVLGEADQGAVRQAVLGHRPCDVGLSGQLWTRQLMGKLIVELYRVRLTEPGVGEYLRRWGLSFQRPDKRAVEQDSEAVRRRHRQTWPEIRAKAKKEGGEVLFAGQVGVRSDQSPAGPGVRRAGRPGCGGAGTGSRRTRCRRSAPRAGCTSWSSPRASPPR